MTTTPIPDSGAASGLRSAAVGSLSGMLAGFLFGVLAMLVQAVITHVTIASYGESRVDYGYASFAQSDVLIVFTLLGSIFGVLYGAARVRLRTPGVPTALGFAFLLVLILEPLLSSGQGGFSAHVDMTQAVTGPSGFAKTFVFAQDVGPPYLLGSILAALVFLQGLAIPLFARLGGQLLPRLPARAYAVIAAGPGPALLGLFLLAVALISGGD